MAVGDVVHVGERYPARRHGGQPPADHVADDAVEAGVRPPARSVDRGRVDDHDLDSLLLGPHQLFRVCLERS